MMDDTYELERAYHGYYDQISRQDLDTCPFCGSLVVFYAMDSHLKSCTKKEVGNGSA